MKTPSRSPIPTVRKKASEVEPSPILPATIDAVLPAGTGREDFGHSHLGRAGEALTHRAVLGVGAHARHGSLQAGAGARHGLDREGRGGEARGQPARGDRREGRGTLCQRCKREERDGAHGS